MAIDLLYNSDGTFQEKDGDINFGTADKYLMEDLLLSVPGHYKEFPTLGVNVYQYINARANVQVISRNIRTGLKADIFNNPTVDLSGFPTMVVNNLELQV